MALFANHEGNYEGCDQPHQLTIYLKTGETLWIVNRYDLLIEVADQLMGESEFDGGDNTVEVRGIKMMPHPIPTTFFIKPWAVAAVELNPVTMDSVKQMASRSKKEGLL